MEFGTLKRDHMTRFSTLAMGMGFGCGNERGSYKGAELLSC